MVIGYTKTGYNMMSTGERIMTREELASYIDHTLLKPDAGKSQIVQLCREAMEYGFWSVCINPVWVPMCSDLLTSSSVKVCTVVGFPLGAIKSEAKAFEAQQAIADGADEIDMVISIGALKDGEISQVQDDIEMVRGVCPGAVLKVIIETCLLTEEEKREACLAAQRAGAEFVKTSTGFAGGGATVEDIRMMHSLVSPGMEVKASGGVRSFSDAAACIHAGAARLGASAGVSIIKGIPVHADY